ncbi:MAG: Dps family protein [Cyclobacteriaceae bacterium]
MKVLVFISILIYSATIAQAQEPQNYQNQQAGTQIPLNENQRQTSADALQATLDELISQRHAVQQAHWNVQGPLFHALHELLGEFYVSIDAIIDEVAERKVIIGVPANGKVGTVAESVNFQELPDGFIPDQQVLTILSSRYKAMSDRLYQRIEETENDLPTQDMLIGVTTMIDKQLWMLRSFQQ